ncbi:hypothetical protein LUX57_26530 [Actinomadura madurae]|nr:hypothetical protein [Actinomadura madurae]MCP9968283.1 hypothetical protein [Actinomadura madurae]
MPANRPRSLWALLCETSQDGMPASSSGMCANGPTPTATTTVRAAIRSPVDSATANPPRPPRPTLTTSASSVPETASAANQRPYSTKVSRGIGCPTRQPRWRSMKRRPSCGAPRLDAKGSDFRYMPSGMLASQKRIGSPMMRTSSPRYRRWAAVDRP